MKDHRVKATRNFFDLEENKERKYQDEFLCTEKRYNDFIEHNNAVELVEIIEVEKPKKNNKKKSK